MNREGLVPALIAVALVALVAAMLVDAADRVSERDVPVVSGAEEERGIAKMYAAVLGFLALVLVIASIDARRESARPPEPEAWVCKHCLQPFVPGAHFCPHCAAPQSFFACTGRYETIYAQAWCLGKAGHHPSRPLHLWGLALVFLAPLSVVISWVLLALEGDLGRSFYYYAPEWTEAIVLQLAWLFAYGSLFLRGLANWALREEGEGDVPPEIEYGSPPWWTFDAEWALPRFEEHEDGPDESDDAPLS